MLNISKNKLGKPLNLESLSAFQKVNDKEYAVWLKKVLYMIFILNIVILFLPWTQNISSKGYLTTLYPDQRPQAIYSTIGGRLEKWYVKEGDFVKEGDTLVFISETKSEYFDEKLIERTSEQVNLKENSVSAYDNKLKAIRSQKEAFAKMRDLKLSQLKNKLKQAFLKVKSDSVDFIAMESQLKIAERQFKRTEELYSKDLKSLKDVEIANIKLQETMAKTIAQENKQFISKNELLNARIEISAIQNEYIEKLSKLDSDYSSIQSDKLDASSNKVKLENQLSNYQIRKGFYYITAHNSGYVTKLVRSGIGEILKEGEKLLTIMPNKYDFAIEFYIDPMNYPLINKGGHVRLQFDGWPAVVFSGWPNSSYGTFGATIFAIDNFISPNGQYRVLAIPDGKDKEWPKKLRVGGGVKTFTLLKTVPIGYELWRNINGFPPEYYSKNNETDNEY
jgi:adhesin transport system membrane fusion protein